MTKHQREIERLGSAFARKMQDLENRAGPDAPPGIYDAEAIKYYRSEMMKALGDLVAVANAS